MRAVTLNVPGLMAVCLCAAVVCSGASDIVAADDDMRPLWWDASGVMEASPSWEVFRWNAYGFGAFPYYAALPGAETTVLVDGVPARPRTPFGYTLDTLPGALVSDMDALSWDMVAFSTKDATVDEPLTTVAFRQGSGRQVTLDYTFQRPLGAGSGLYLAGSSNGTHISGPHRKNSLRHYYLKYHQAFGDTMRAEFAVRAYRDRDGLADIATGTHMGESKADDQTVSLRVTGIRIGESTTVAPVMYYTNGDVRFDRYGDRKTMEDDTGGLRFDICRRGKTWHFRHATGYELTSWESRIHDASWTRREVFWGSTVDYTAENLHATAGGRATWSSEYGSGWNAETGVEYGGENGFGITVHALAGQKIPASGFEYYPALTFSDTVAVGGLSSYRVVSVEGGVRYRTERFEIAGTVFSGSSEAPHVQWTTYGTYGPAVTSPVFADSDAVDRNGMKCSWKGLFDWYAHYRIAGSLVHHFGGTDRSLWPYPDVTSTTTLSAERDILDGKMRVNLFGKGIFHHWDEAGYAPAGARFLFDGGLSIRVDTLELFYYYENIFDEEIRFFGTGHFLERTSFWGVNWQLYR